MISFGLDPGLTINSVECMYVFKLFPIEIRILLLRFGVWWRVRLSLAQYRRKKNNLGSRFCSNVWIEENWEKKNLIQLLITSRPLPPPFHLCLTPSLTQALKHLCFLSPALSWWIDGIWGRQPPGPGEDPDLMPLLSSKDLFLVMHMSDTANRRYE